MLYNITMFIGALVEIIISLCVFFWAMGELDVIWRGYKMQRELGEIDILGRRITK